MRETWWEIGAVVFVSVLFSIVFGTILSCRKKEQFSFADNSDYVRDHALGKNPSYATITNQMRPAGSVAGLVLTSHGGKRVNAYRTPAL